MEPGAKMALAMVVAMVPLIIWTIKEGIAEIRRRNSLRPPKPIDNGHKGPY